MASGRRCCHGQGWTTPRVVRESGVAERRGIGARRAKLATQRVQRVHRTAASASAAPSRQPSRPAFLARCSADVRLPDTASTQSCTSLSRAMPSGPHAARRLAARSALSQPLRLIRPPAPAACGPCPLRQPLALRAMSLWAQFPASRGTGSLAERRGPPEAAGELERVRHGSGLTAARRQHPSAPPLGYPPARVSTSHAAERARDTDSPASAAAPIRQRCPTHKWLSSAAVR
jgi:hypothetical protein